MYGRGRKKIDLENCRKWSEMAKKLVKSLFWHHAKIIFFQKWRKIGQLTFSQGSNFFIISEFSIVISQFFVQTKQGAAPGSAQFL